MSHSDDGRDEADDHDLGSDDDGDEGEAVREQDRYLPIANIARIMKRSLPQNAKIAKDAKETVQECVSEFISFITSEGELCWRCRLRNGHPRELWSSCRTTADSLVTAHDDCLHPCSFGGGERQRVKSASRRSGKPSTEKIFCGQ
jgi:histone H3/H4